MLLPVEKKRGAMNINFAFLLSLAGDQKEKCRIVREEGSGQAISHGFFLLCVNRRQLSMECSTISLTA